MPARLTLLAAVLVCALLPAAAARGQVPADPGGPLVYVFSLDGLDGDRVDSGRAPFLLSLIRGEQGARSTLFRESRAIMVAETNPNHTAMATGAYGNRSGIPGNAFALYGPTENGDSCTLTGPVDESKPPTEVSGENANCLQAQTFFEAAQRGPSPERLVTAGFFGKPKLARIFEGKNADPGRYDADYLWTPCGNGSSEPYCKSTNSQGAPIATRPNDSYTVLDSDVMDDVMRTVREGVPGDGRTFTGGGRRPNLTFVNFPGIDNSGHGTGTGAQYDNAIAMADDEIERFVTQQKALGLWERTVMLVVSDHSMDQTPQAGATSLDARFQKAGIDSGAYSIVQNGSAALVYLSNRRDPDRFELLKTLRAAALDGAPPSPAAPFGPPVVDALYREPNPADGGMAETLDARHPGWNLTGARTGDLVVTSQSGVALNPLLTGNHGGPQTRDNLAAVVGGSPLINQRSIEGIADPRFDDTLRNPAQSEQIDIAPTALRLLGRPAPAQNQGRVLTEAFDTARLAAIPVTSAPGTTTRGPGGGGSPGSPGSTGSAACTAGTGFRSASVRGAGRGLRVSLARRATGPASFDLFQVSRGTRILGNRRVARLGNRRSTFTYRGRGLRDGYYFARLRIAGARGRQDVRRFALERRGGRFRTRPAFARPEGCGAISLLGAERPVFGGRSNRALNVAYRLGASGRVTVTLRRGGRTVRRLGTSNRAAGRVFRLRTGAERLRRGTYSVRVAVAGADGRTTTSSVSVRRL